MNKEIEKMALILSEGGCGNTCDCIQGDKFNCHLLHSASVLYAAGYRKRSEGDNTMNNQRRKRIQEIAEQLNALHDELEELSTIE